MKVSLKKLHAKASSRPVGYVEDVLSKSIKLDDDTYEIPEREWKELVKKYRPAPIGLGDLAQKVIHAGVDAAPISAKRKNAIKSCGGCKKRRSLLNRIIPDIHLPNRPSSP